jgi:hypothetical protein
MRSLKDIKRSIAEAKVHTNERASQQVLDSLMAKLAQRNENRPTDPQSQPWRMIMTSPKTKLGAVLAGGMILAVLLGAFEFTGTSGTSSVAWAEAARKVENSTGFTFHQRIVIDPPDRPEQIAYVVAYLAGPRMRQDWSLEPEGPPFKTDYYDFDAKTAIYVRHDEKTCLRVPMTERMRESRESGWFNPKDWVRQIVSSEYKELGRRTIEGVQCEGIETTKPTFADANPPATKMMSRLWVNVETRYPVRLEIGSTHGTTDGGIQFKALCEQFQWDVELSPKLFEPDIPSDYKRRP